MVVQVSLREVNQNFSRYVRVVEQGDEVLITRRGKPVARLVPEAQTRVLTRAQEEALERTRRRMDEGFHLGGDRIVREALHDR